MIVRFNCIKRRCENHISKTIKYSKMIKLIKQLQNLYSWNQFYQERKLRKEMRVAQAQISSKKREINEFKLNQRNRRNE